MKTTIFWLAMIFCAISIFQGWLLAAIVIMPLALWALWVAWSSRRALKHMAQERADWIDRGLPVETFITGEALDEDLARFGGDSAVAPDAEAWYAG